MMRTNEQMMELILGTAKEDNRIRAVCMNGSRTNPNAPIDIFMDYDIVYLVNDDTVQEFIDDKNWINRFGELTVKQEPEGMEVFPPANKDYYVYLCQFTDLNRIDLTILPISQKDKYCNDDKLTVILLDKDGVMPEIPAPSDEDYHVKKPSESEFLEWCNEFWWVAPYVAKGLWRDEFTYARTHLDSIINPILLKMLEYKIGIQTNFSVSVGKNSKYLKKYLSGGDYTALLNTYYSGGIENTWKGLISTCELFASISLFVANSLGFSYPQQDVERVTNHIKRVHEMSL